MYTKKIYLCKLIPTFAVLSLLSQSAFVSAVDAATVMNWNDDSGIPHDTVVDIENGASTEISASNGIFNDGLYALVSGEDNYITGTVSDTQFYSETGNPLKLDAEDGTASLTVDHSTFATGDTDLSHDIDVMGGQGSSLIIDNNSVLNEGALAWAGAGNASVVVSDSSVGADVSPGYNDNYALTAQISHSASTHDGTAEVDVESQSTINGNIAAQAQNEGNAIVNLSGSSKVNGYIYVIGQNMQVNISDGATLDGNIYTGAFHDSEVSDTDSTIAFSDTTYRHDIISQDDPTSIDNELTVNINGGAIIGGETLDDPMQVKGYSSVNFNINYVDASLIDTGKVSYFYVNNDENVLINSSLATGSLSPIRSGSYIYSDVMYQATDDSQQTTTADSGKTYGVTFYTQDEDNDIPDSDPDVTPDTMQTASDIQATQAGLMASDEMIHYVAEGISTELENDSAALGGNLWIHGIYAGNNRRASQTAYSNDIGGFQIGGDNTYGLSNNDKMSVGLAYARLHNNLDLTDDNGGTDINGDYYSAYLRWSQHPSQNDRSHLFADAEFTYGTLNYSSNGNDAGIVSGGDYRGHSYLLQSRFGKNISVSNSTWLTPYALLGYDNIHQDGYTDGYSDIGEGKLHSGFYGAGLKASHEFALSNNRTLTPFMDISYTGQFANDAHLATADYTFSGQNLNGSKVGAGIMLQAGKHWHTMLSVNSFYGHGVNADLDALLSVRYTY